MFSPRHAITAAARYHGDVELSARLASALAPALAEARARWPGVAVAPDAFTAWIAARLPDETPPPPAPALELERALAALRLTDLYLACACAAGDNKALAAFDAAYLRAAKASDDVKQRLREKLFVAAPGAPAPRIALYAGRGDLGAWVRASLTRLTIDDQRAARELPTEDALLIAIGIDPAHDPELMQVKKDARAALQAAFREAVATLTDRDRTLLLQHYIDGVGVVELGKLFELAPSNISRTLAKTRVQLVAQVRRALMRNRRIAGDELDDLVDLVRSQLSLTGGLRRP